MTWDSRTYPCHLTQKLAAAEEASRRNADNAAFSTSTIASSDPAAADILPDYYGDDDTGVSIIPSNPRRCQTELFVKDPFNAFLKAGFSDDNSIPSTSPRLLSGGTQEDAIDNISRFSAGVGSSVAAKFFMTSQKSSFENRSSTYAFSLADSIERTTSVVLSFMRISPQQWSPTSCSYIVLQKWN